MHEFRTIDADGVRLRAAVQGTGPLVLLVHGFPESWFSWRHQMGPIAAAGFTACAVDLRGYGGSDKPRDVEAYAVERMTADLAAVAEAMQPGAPAILVGHDWGATIVWTTALARPEFVRAVCGLSVPFAGVPTRPFTEVFHEQFTARNRFFYQAWFQQAGPPEAELEADVAMSLRTFYSAISGDAPADAWPKKPAGASLLGGMVDPGRPPSWLTEADLAYYVAEFTRSGFRGPLNRYRNHERDFAWLQAFKDRVIEQPALFIGGTRDPVLSFSGRDWRERMQAWAPRLAGVDLLEGCGHWTQQERPQEVTELLVDWLKAL